MARPSKFSDEEILAAAQKLEDEGREISGYALSVALGGGRPSSLGEKYAELTATRPAAVELPALPSEITATLDSLASDMAQRLNQAMTTAHATLKSLANARIDEIEKTADAERAKHKAQLDDAVERIGTEQDRADTAETALATANADLKAKIEDAHRLDVAATRAEDALKASQAREAALTESLEKLRQDHLDATRQVGLQSSEIDALHGKNKALTTEKADAVAQRDAANKQREEAQRDAAAQGARVGQLQESEKRLHGEVATLNQVTGKQAAEVAQLQASVKALQEAHAQELARLQQTLSEQTKSLSAKDEEISKLKAAQKR